MLKDKKIIIGICGSIAAYKSILLIRLLVKAGAEVKVVITPSAKDFVSPLVLSTLSKNSVISELSNDNNWSNHVELGRWADLMIIAPLSCNTLAKMAQGNCDNLLMAVYLSATCPVIVAPAMDEDMWLHPSRKRNLATIESFGNKIISVEKGELASGLFGEGRMAEPEDIFESIKRNLLNDQKLVGTKVLVTAGPTYEAIDPVRFIGNHSSGKMGYAIAESFLQTGADVTLISGPTNLTTNSSINLINVVTSDEMYNEVDKQSNTADIIIMCAAVADYKVINEATQKIKKNEDSLSLELIKTKDILHHLGKNKKPNQFLVGFALETENEIINAEEKLIKKNLDCIILNKLNSNNKVFGSDRNEITIIDAKKTTHKFEANTKKALAKEIVSFIISKIEHEKN